METRLKIKHYAPAPREIMPNLWISVQEAPKDISEITNSGGKELRILVTGKTGQGKSTLINGLLGAEVAREGASADRCTTEVEKFEQEINGVPVVVFDSPGLQDNTSNEEEYIQSMNETCQELSLVLYCTKMGNTRLAYDDKKAMKKLTEAFGLRFWYHAVFVLTFANKENVKRWDDRDNDDPSKEPPLSDEEAWELLEKTRFEGRVQLWEEELRRFLINEVKVDPSIANGIPVVPTGDHVATHDNPTPLCLPDRDNWFQELWKVCFFQVKEQDLLLKINNHRMIAEDQGEDEPMEDQLAKVPVLVIPGLPTTKKTDLQSKVEIEVMARSLTVKEVKKILKGKKKQSNFRRKVAKSKKLRKLKSIYQSIKSVVKRPSAQMDDKSVPVSVSSEAQKADPPPKHNNHLKPPQSDITQSKEVLQEKSEPQLQNDQEDSIPSSKSTTEQNCTEEMPQSEDNSKGAVNITHAPSESKASTLNEVLKIWAPDHHKELKLLVTGKTGVGKSTLVNGILGAEVAKEGAASATRCTTEVTEYQAELHGVPVTVFDSPGLQDITESEDQYIADMKMKCKNLGLVLYCTKMTSSCLIADDRYAILKLTAEFGQEFWEHAVLVLTFANREDPSRRDERDEDEGPEPDFDDEAAWKELEKKRFKGRVKKWKDGFYKFLTDEVGVTRDIVEKIPVVPAGDHRKSRENMKPLRLPDRKNWLGEFWVACSLRMRGKSYQLRELEHRIEMEAEQRRRKELERQAEEQKEVIAKQAELIRQESKKQIKESAKLGFLLDEKPLQSDLFRIFKSSVVHSRLIGTALDVKVNDLLHLPQLTNDNLISVFERWSASNEDVSWRKIIQVCDYYPEELGQARVVLKRFFQEKGHKIFS